MGTGLRFGKTEVLKVTAGWLYNGANALTAAELFTRKMVKTVSFMLCLFITIKK